MRARLSPLEYVTIGGLAAGAVFGLAGTLVTAAPVRQVLWGIDGIGLVIATTLLALRHFRRGQDALAAGFLVFAMGECLLISATAGGLEASVPSFGGGVGLWAAGLLLISVPPVLPSWVRLTGVLGALLFSVVCLRILAGEILLPLASPLPFFAYPFVVLTFVGWIVSLFDAGPR